MSSSCKLGEWIQSGIHAFYYKWGHFVGRKPWTVIGGSTFIALIPIVALLIRLPIETEVRSDCHPPSLRLSSRACVRACCARLRTTTHAARGVAIASLTSTPGSRL